MAFRIHPDASVDPGNDRDHPLPVAANGSSGRRTIGALPASGTNFVRISWLGGGPDPSIALAADAGDDTSIPIDGAVHPVFNRPGGQGGHVGDAQVARTSVPGVYLIRLFLNAAATWAITFANNDARAHGVVWVVADSDDDSQQPWIHLTVAGVASPEIRFSAVAGGPQLRHDIEVTNFGTGPITVTGFNPPITAPYGAATFPVTIGPNSTSPAREQVSFNPPARAGERPVSQHRLVTAGKTDAGPFGSGHNDRISLSAQTLDDGQSEGEVRCSGRRESGLPCECTSFIPTPNAPAVCRRPGCHHSSTLHTFPQ